MFGNPMLDVAIGLIFFYLLISIIVTVLQEYIASFLQLRNRNLLKAVKELVGDRHLSDFFKHPLIFPLFKGDMKGDVPKGRGPAYIPSRNFALAILDIQNRLASPQEKPADRGTPQEKPGHQGTPREPAFQLASLFTNAAFDASLGERLNHLDATASTLFATNTVDTAVKELETLFDSTMARAAGWYKRQAQWIALVISVLLATALNADSIYVGQRLWEDEALRNQAVASAEAFYRSADGQDQLTSLCTAKATAPAPEGAAGTDAAEGAEPGATEEGAGQDAAEGATEPGATAGTEELTLEQWGEVRECTEREIQKAMDQLAGYPIGWRGWKDNSWWPVGQPDQDPIWAVLGIFLQVSL